MRKTLPFSPPGSPFPTKKPPFLGWEGGNPGQNTPNSRSDIPTPTPAGKRRAGINQEHSKFSQICFFLFCFVEAPQGQEGAAGGAGKGSRELPGLVCSALITDLHGAAPDTSSHPRSLAWKRHSLLPKKKKTKPTTKPQTPAGPTRVKHQQHLQEFLSPPLLVFGLPGASGKQNLGRGSLREGRRLRRRRRTEAPAWKNPFFPHAEPGFSASIPTFPAFFPAGLMFQAFLWKLDRDPPNRDFF